VVAGLKCAEGMGWVLGSVAEGELDFHGGGSRAGTAEDRTGYAALEAMRLQEGSLRVEA
jgi:hypothetical protein